MAAVVGDIYGEDREFGQVGRAGAGGRRDVQEVRQRPLELLDDAVADDPARSVESGLSGEEDHGARGGAHGMAESGRRREMRRIDALQPVAARARGRAALTVLCTHRRSRARPALGTHSRRLPSAANSYRTPRD